MSEQLVQYSVDRGIARIALDSPVFGAVLAAGVLIGAYFRIPDDCPVGQHCGVHAGTPP